MNNQAFFTKNRSARTAICALLCIPLVAAVILAVKIDPNSVSADAVKSLTVTVNGTSSVFTDEASLSVYSDISKNAREIDASFRDFSEETPYEITFTESDGSTLTYSLYTLEDENDCIFKNSEGKFFMMDPECAKNLLVREEFSNVNQASYLPVATYERNGVSVTLSPSEYNWTYKALDGSDVVSNSSKSVKNPVFKLDGNGISALTFDREPDSVKILITKDGETVFDDVPENLAGALSYKSDTKLDVTVTAEWYELEGAEYHGTLTYRLNGLFDIEPTYSVVDDHALPKGDFTIIRMSDFNDGETLTVQNDLGIPEKVKVYDKSDENIKFAFVPLGASCEVGSHTLTLSTEDGNVQTINVSVKEPAKAFGSQTVIVTNETLQNAFTSAGFDEFSAKAAELTSASENAILWDGKFVYPTSSSSIVAGGTGYGMTRDIKSLYSSKYISDGMELAASAGSDVKASNSGKVVFAGELTLTGKTVIVDHGSGVLSYYGHLSEISTSVGQDVTTESVLGKAGSTGFACNSNGNNVTMVQFAISLGGVFIDPSSPCKYGINF